MEREKALQWLFDHGCDVGEYPSEIEGLFVIVPAWSVVESPEWSDVLQGVTEYDEEKHHDSDYWGFYDEYTTCSECGHIIRTSPTHYGWTADYWLSEDGIMCGGCVRSDFVDDYIDWCAQQGAVSCNLLDDLEDHGFVLILQRLEHGLHHGQNDDPRKVTAWAADHGLAVLWRTSPSQFTVEFDGWFAWAECPVCHGDNWRDCERCKDKGQYIPLTSEEITQVEDALVEEKREYTYFTVTYLRSEFKQWPSPAENAERALRGLSKPFAKIDTDTGEVSEYDTFEEYCNG